MHHTHRSVSADTLAACPRDWFVSRIGADGATRAEFRTWTVGTLDTTGASFTTRAAMARRRDRANARTALRMLAACAVVAVLALVSVVAS